MSLRVVRRLLQQTADLSTQNPQEDDQEFHRAKRRQHKTNPNKVPVGEKQVIQHQINSILFLDQKMASNDSKKTVTATRLQEKHQKQKRIEKVTAKKIVGNSRSSTSAFKKAPIPTFNKKRYQEQQKEKKLAQIAKLLKKNSTKNPITTK